MKSQTFRSSKHAYMWHYCSELFEPELAERVFKAETPADRGQTYCSRDAQEGSQ